MSQATHSVCSITTAQYTALMYENRELNTNSKLTVAEHSKTDSHTGCCEITADIVKGDMQRYITKFMKSSF